MMETLKLQPSMFMKVPQFDQNNYAARRAAPAIPLVQLATPMKQV